MATTTNYGWTTPDDTSLVKDGAAAIRTLGSSIDTSLNTALGTKKAGMVLLNTTSFSGVSSYALPNGSFTTNFDHYKVLLKFIGSTTAGVNARLRSSGTDTTTGYYGNTMYQVYNLATVSGGSINNSTTIDFSAADAANVTFAEITVGSPFLSERTTFFSTDWGADYTRFWRGVVSNTTSYDSINFYPGSGTITGKVSVYGFNK